jgi:hypothetical protein
MLMHSCEIVVVDLSWVKEGTAWELNELHQRALLTRCIFVAGESGAAELAVLRRPVELADRIKADEGRAVRPRLNRPTSV